MRTLIFSATLSLLIITTANAQTPADTYADICYYAMLSNNVGAVESTMYKITSPTKTIDYALWVVEQKPAGLEVLNSTLDKIFSMGYTLSDAQLAKAKKIAIDIKKKRPASDGATFTALALDKKLSTGQDLWQGLPESGKQNNIDLLIQSEAQAIDFLLDGGLNKSINEVGIIKDWLARRLEPAIKKYLRKNGKSFVSIVGPDGKVSVNPITDASKPIIDALNAPKCEGLEAALREIGIDVPDYDRTRITTLVPDYMDKIMYGEIPFNNVGSILMFLGVDGYNKWVDEYNNGTPTTKAADTVEKKN